MTNHETTALCIAHGGDVGEPSGGTDRVTALARGLHDRGLDVTLVVPEPSGDLPARLVPVDVRFAGGRSDSGVVRASRVVRAARRVARDRDARLQLEHSSLAGVATLHGLDGFVLDMHDVAYSRFDHVDASATKLYRHGVAWLERRAVDRAAHVVVVSERMRELLRREWDVPAGKTSVVPNGFFPDRVRDARDAPVTPGRVAFFGTLHPKVDVETLDALARLPSVSELVAVGDGAQRDRLERLAEANDALRVTGRLPDEEAFDLLGRSEVLVNPQAVSDIQRTSSPVKLFYYAALGKPMVVTSGPSVVDGLVRSGAAVTARSGWSFVPRVRAVLGNERLSDALAGNALASSDGFRWSERVAAFERVYREEGLTDGAGN